MSLKVELTIEQTELVFQQDTAFEVTITNQAHQAVQTLHPQNCLTLPGLKVVSLKDGHEENHRRTATMFTHEFPQPLEPGQSWSGAYRLLQYMGFSEPGEYEISAMWEWDDASGRSFSEPVKVTVHGVQPRNVYTVSTVGGPGSVFYSVFIDIGQSPARLSRTGFSIVRKPEMFGTQSFGPINAAAEPCLSTPINGGATQQQWVAWFEGNDLRMGLLDHEVEEVETKVLSLSPVPKQIVPPLNHLEGAGGLTGRFFLWQGNVEGDISRFQAVNLDSQGNPKAGANLELTGTRPRWVQAAFPSDRTCRTYAITQSPDQVELQGATWSADGEPPEEVQQLGQIPGQFHGAAAMLAADDTVHGAILILEPGKEESQELGLYSWSQQPDGAFKVGDILLVPRQPKQRIERAIVAVGIQGEPVALIRFKGEPWQFFRQQTGIITLPDPVAETKLPLELFFPDSSDPLIKYCFEDKGFYFMKHTGAPAGPPISG